jgi:hypothetical protein
MGFKHKAAGYVSAGAMVRFIISEGLDDDLREHRWEGFARGYARHGYQTKLAAAYAKWARRPDAVVPPR